jgi:poly-gamma-glutamate synthase PgsB/CapB
MTFEYLNDWEVLRGVLAAFLLACGWLAVSAHTHRRAIAAVPIRIHVSGSRGKTTTARLIGAGLRAGGLRVLTKTTGTNPMLILPDGKEMNWSRWGAPTIAEQERFFRQAARLKVDAVVLEAMAIEPEYLWASERYLVQATHVAITNVRPDHAEVLGASADAMGKALSLVVPRKGNLFLTEEAAVAPIIARAHKLGSVVEVIDIGGLSSEDSNRRLAEAVCGQLGIDHEQALEGMRHAGSDPGAFFVVEREIAGRPVRFYNAFACNDPQSFEQLWSEHRPAGTAAVLLNSRYDRPARTRAFLEMLAAIEPPVNLVLAGELSSRWVWDAGFPVSRVRRLRARAPEAVLGEAAAASPDGMVWGVGNYMGLGEKLVRHFRGGNAPC